MNPSAASGGFGGRGSRAPAGHSRSNTIGLQRGALDTLLTRMDGPVKTAPMRRKFIRWPFRHESIPIKICHPGGSEAINRVACRNLSRGGMSLLHGAFVHGGSRCIVILPHQRRGPVPIPGCIVRCEHRGGRVHELGVVFDAPINVREFLTSDPFEFHFSLEQVPPAELHGTIVHLARSPGDRQLIRHALRETSLNVRSVSTTEDLLAQVKLGCDLVIFEVGEELGEAAELLDILAASAPKVRVIAITPDAGPARRAQMNGLPVAAVFAKPLRPNTLVRAVAEFLLVDRNTDAIEHDDGNAVNDIELLAAELERAAAESNLVLATRAAEQVQSLARNAGWSTLLKVAKLACAGLAEPDATSKVAEVIRDLAALCRQNPDAWA